MKDDGNASVVAFWTGIHLIVNNALFSPHLLLPLLTGKKTKNKPGPVPKSGSFWATPDLLHHMHTRTARAESQKRAEGNNMGLLFFGSCVNSLRHGLFAGQDSTRVLSFFSLFSCFLQPVSSWEERVGKLSLRLSAVRVDIGKQRHVLPLLSFTCDGLFWREKTPFDRIWIYYF